MKSIPMCLDCGMYPRRAAHYCVKWLKDISRTMQEDCFVGD